MLFFCDAHSGETQRVLVSIYRYCFIKADMTPFGGWVEQRETIERNDSRCLSFLRNSPPVPPISRPTSPLSLSLSASPSLLPSLTPSRKIVDVRLINWANCFMAWLAWSWQHNQAEWGGLGEAITLPIVIKDRRTRLGHCTLEGLGHRQRPSSSVHCCSLW